ncbi:MAG: alpha/beta hydrolase [Lachnospiraceae bacterium]|nr:alpha/beta hydrolase [Lachnospiraceae bacterium]
MSRYYQVKKVKIPSTGRDIRLLVFIPKKNKRPKEETPGILWIHGGGFLTGMPEMIYFTRGLSLVRKYGAVVVTPAYRLSGEAPYPAALDDCYSALKYLKEHADELDFNPDKIMVGGESAGGGLTASVCMCARDKGEVNVAFQMPLYPMLDDRDTDSSRDNKAPVWNTKRNHKAWKIYLGGLWQKEVPVYAAPARQEDYSNLPPAYTFVGDIEPFYCETLTYVEKLREAGIEANVDVYPKWFHAYDLYFPFSKMGKQAIAEFEKRYLYAAEHYSAAQSKKEG